jgi:hypothetical protein
VSQPDYVSVTPRLTVRVGEFLSRADHWVPDRPGEVRNKPQRLGPQLGNPGPDQGYALKLAHGLTGSLVLAPHEHAEDAIAGCVEVAMRRAALYGRAPVIHDVKLAFTLFGFLGGGPPELQTWRRPRFAVAAHSYPVRRAIVDCVPDATLKLSVDEVASRLGSFRELLVSAAHA